MSSFIKLRNELPHKNESSQERPFVRKRDDGRGGEGKARRG